MLLARVVSATDGKRMRRTDTGSFREIDVYIGDAMGQLST